MRRCRAWRVGLPVSVMLNRACRILGAAVPEEVVEELAGGRPSRLLVRQLSAWAPAGRMPAGRSVRNGLTRSLRDDLLATAGEFAGQTRQAIAQMLRPGGAGPGGPGHGGSGHGGSGHGDGSGFSAGLESYLELVESADRYGHLGPVRSPRPGVARPGPARR